MNSDRGERSRPTAVVQRGASLADRAEASIRRLPGVEEVRVQADGDQIREIHVLTGSGKSGKLIARDVTSLLHTTLGLSIDHRIVSVVAANPKPGMAAPPAAPVVAAAELVAALTEPEAPADERYGAGAPAAERMRFESVNLYVAGPRTQAQVELRWKGLPRMGSASGWSTRDESHRLVAVATATAVQEFVADPIALGVHGVEFVDVGRRRVAVVSLSLLVQRQEKLLTGCCMVEQDTPQAVVLATLAAVNRIVGGLRVKEPTEYVLRPTPA